MMDTTGEVIATEGTTAKVKFLRTAACKNCGACLTLSDTELVIDIPNTLDARVGDYVRIELHSSSVAKASLIMYGIPLLALIGFMFIGGQFGDIWAAVAGIAAAVLAYIVLHCFEPKFARMGKFSPKMTAILDASEKIEPPNEGENNQ